ncbi:MAG: hypothetical protein ACXVP5_12735, partial [Tumebacillaceae bacterium]
MKKSLYRVMAFVLLLGMISISLNKNMVLADSLGQGTVTNVNMPATQQTELAKINRYFSQNQ